MSVSSRGQTILIIKELHLTPHFVYMTSSKAETSSSFYSLSMQKDFQTIAQTDQLFFIEPTDLIKYPALEFGKVRFVFNVKSLFQEEAAVKLTLQLYQQSGLQEKELIEEFEVNLLHYSYEHSREKVVKHKENSFGKKNQYILNYSFAAIYGRVNEAKIISDSMRERVKEQLGEDSNIKENEEDKGGFNIVVRDPLTEKKQENPLVKVETRSQSGGLGVPGQSDWQDTVSVGNRSYFGSSEGRQKEMIIRRRVPRSMLMVQDPTQSQASSIAETDVSKQLKLIRQKGSVYANWIFLTVGTLLIYWLMHPASRV